MILSIIIPCKNISDSLFSLLQSCKEQTLNVQKFEILVIYNSLGNNLSTATSLENVRFFQILKKNASAARNLGAENATGRFLYFLDDDTVLPDKNHLILLIDLMEKFGDRSVLGGGYLNVPGTLVISRATNAIANLWLQYNLQHSAVQLLGGNICVHSKIFKDAKFPEELPWCGEESVFLDSVRSNSGTVHYLPEISIFHVPKPGLKKLISRSWASGKNIRHADGTPRPRTVGLRFLFSKISTEALMIVPFILLHFAVLELAKAFSQIRPDTQVDKTPRSHSEK